MDLHNPVLGDKLAKWPSYIMLFEHRGRGRDSDITIIHTNSGAFIGTHHGSAVIGHTRLLS